MSRFKLEFFSPERAKELMIPLFISAVEAGFPSPADDSIDQSLNLNDLLIEHPAATFFVRVQGSSMKNAQISDGDILIVDRALEPKDYQIVVAVLDGEFTVKRIRIKNTELFLEPENPDYPSIKVSENSDFQSWGVVTFIIHKSK